MRITPEVGVFHKEVGGEKQVIGCAAGPENRAIVTDSEDDSGVSRKRRPLTDPLD